MVTAKQRKFYKRLYAMCKENGVDATTHHEHTRVGYAQAIDTLLGRLQAAEVDVHGSGKHAEIVLTIGEDRAGRLYTRESIRVTDEPPQDGEAAHD